MVHKINDVIVSLKRGLDILRSYQGEDITLNNSELAGRTGLPKSTIARFTYTLTKLGYLQPGDRQGSYRLGDKVVAPGQKLLGSLPACQLAQPLMQEFAARHGVSLALATGHESSMAYLAYCSGGPAASGRFRTGAVVPMAHTAVGRAYLWALRPARRSEYFALIAAEAGDGADQLLSDIVNSFGFLDGHGYYWRTSQWRGEAYSVAAPLLLARDDAVLALACSVSHQQAGDEGLQARLGDGLVKLAAAIANTMADIGQSFWDD